MKSSTIENVIVDEANQRMYVVRARRQLTDGEFYSLIRQEILRRGKSISYGGTLTLTAAEEA